MGPDSGNLFSGGLLPNGSILRDVVRPSYDEYLRLASTVTAGEMTIFTRDEVRPKSSGEGVETRQVLDKVEANALKIRFFNRDRSGKGQITLETALLENRGGTTLLLSDKPVAFVSDDVNVTGSALAFDTAGNRGFLHGPVRATLNFTTFGTSMHATPSSGALVAGALMMAAASVAPAQEPTPPATTAELFEQSRLTAEEFARLAEEAQSSEGLMKEAGAGADAAIRDSEAQSVSAKASFGRFVQAAALTGILADATPDELPDVPKPEVEEGKDLTRVESSAGAYFDTSGGLYIFLGDVTVENKELKLKGASEVKIFADPPKKEAKKDEPEAQATKEGEPEVEITEEMIEKMRAAKAAQAAGGNEKGGEASSDQFGDFKKLIATGPAVHVRFTPEKEGKGSIEASAHTFIYEAEDERLILEGGSPWVMIDNQVHRVEGREAYIVVYLDGQKLSRVVTHNGRYRGNVNVPESSNRKPTNR